MYVKHRNIGLCILFSILTCGLYMIYWIIRVNDELNYLAENRGPEGWKIVLFSILTCGIYLLYWFYCLGQNVDYIQGNDQGYSSVIYLVLAVLLLGIVPLSIAQDAINETTLV